MAGINLINLSENDYRNYLRTGLILESPKTLNDSNIILSNDPDTFLNGEGEFTEAGSGISGGVMTGNVYNVTGGVNLKTMIGESLYSQGISIWYQNGYLFTIDYNNSLISALSLINGVVTEITTVDFNGLTSYSSPTQIYGDGTYLYVTVENSYISVLSFDGSNFTFEGDSSSAGVTTGGYQQIWSDGTYIYCFDFANKALTALQFSGGSLNIVGNPIAVTWGDYAPVYCMNGYIFGYGYETSLEAYTFDGTDFTLVTQTTEKIYGYTNLMGDGTYLYTVDYDKSILYAYSFDGITFNMVGMTSISNYFDYFEGYISHYNGLIYLTSTYDNEYGVAVYSFDGSGFNEVYYNSLNDTPAGQVWSSSVGTYIIDYNGGIWEYKAQAIPFPVLKIKGNLLSGYTTPVFEIRTYLDEKVATIYSNGDICTIGNYVSDGVLVNKKLYAESLKSPEVKPIALGHNSIAMGDNAQASSNDMFVYGCCAGFNATDAYNSNFLGYYAGISATNAYSSNFLGNGAGQSATNACYSNFLGSSAGVNATNAWYSNFLGSEAGYSATNACNSNFLGSEAGYSATNACNSNFLGNYAGYLATNAFYSNFMGCRAGMCATNSKTSNYLGVCAGMCATNACQSNFLGLCAGFCGTAAANSNFMGFGAGYKATGATRSNFFGINAGNNAVGAFNSNFLGGAAGCGATNACYSNFIGNNAGTNAISACDSNFLGWSAGNCAKFAFESNFLGTYAGFCATNACHGVFIGYQAGLCGYAAPMSVFIGQNAGFCAFSADRSVFVGNNSGSRSTNANYSIFIGNSAGNGATNFHNSSAIGNNAGVNITNGCYSNLIGYQAGYGATCIVTSNFIGSCAGQNAISACNSNFIGNLTGSGATTACYSNIFGSFAGMDATNACYSTLVGYSVGKSFTGNNIGANNIIIGTNVSMPNGCSNSVNIGGIIFGKNTYSTTSGNPSITANSTGMVGIGVVNPTANLHIKASTTAQAMMKLEVGSAPSSPNDGDVWLESNSNTGLKIRIAGVTKTITLS